MQNQKPRIMPQTPLVGDMSSSKGSPSFTLPSPRKMISSYENCASNRAHDPPPNPLGLQKMLTTPSNPHGSTDGWINPLKETPVTSSSPRKGFFHSINPQRPSKPSRLL